MNSQSQNHPEPVTVYRKDYRPPNHLVQSVELTIHLDAEETLVESMLTVQRNQNGNPVAPLVLDGKDLTLNSIELNGKTLLEEEYELTEEQLVIHETPDSFTLTISNTIYPSRNTSLEGLYSSNTILCTQCEANGFRKITWYPDRPDVLARFKVTLLGDPHIYPVMLSNGNCIEQKTVSENLAKAVWEDPFPKPCYLFAVVAGNLALHQSSYTTLSGKSKTLQIYVEPENRDKTDYAMKSLKKAMQWDEVIFGLEYDLDTFMIVAVNDFNMGAMENKGLNIFNAKYVLAKPETATDSDFENIESVIAHEYFHNWTGNRVTCRDWFQLSLKEGLTVFRDQEFSSDVTSRAVKRINDVRILRTHQFQEDSGPTAHPVRPDSYIEMNNLYTVTVYNKGAEVIRMMHSLLGKKLFRKGMDLYFERHDGQAVTCDDFAQAMSDAGEIDLTQFKLWYSQAGTPLLQISDSFDSQAHRYSLTVKQSCPATPDQPEKAPFHIPLSIGLITPKGRNLKLFENPQTQEACSTTMLDVKEPEQTFVFEGLNEKPVPSLLRNFSAPVKLEYNYTDEELMLLMAHDEDDFCRWDAGQQLATRLIIRTANAFDDGDDPDIDEDYLEAFARILDDTNSDRSFRSLALTLPSEGYLIELFQPVDIDSLHKAREFLRTVIAETHEELLLSKYQSSLKDEPYQPDPESIGRRSLKNLCLGYLMSLEHDIYTDLCVKQYKGANNMTDGICALSMLCHVDSKARTECLDHFYNRWQKDPLVIDKWFSIQAQAKRKQTLNEVTKLLEHPAYNRLNPNRVRALVGAFSQNNLIAFHNRNGSGYQFLADQVIELDQTNPQTAARLISPLIDWRKFDSKRQTLMKEQLNRVIETEGLSKNTFEIASKGLAT